MKSSPPPDGVESATADNVPTFAWFGIAVVTVLASMLVGAFLSGVGVGIFYVVFRFFIEPNPPPGDGAQWVLLVPPGPFGAWGNAWLWGVGIVSVGALPSMAVLAWRKHRRRSSRAES